MEFVQLGGACIDIEVEVLFLDICRQDLCFGQMRERRAAISRRQALMSLTFAGLVLNLARALWTGELNIDAVGIGTIPKTI